MSAISKDEQYKRKLVSERMEAEELKEGCEIVKTMLRFIGENAERDGLKKTPNRVVKSWQELFSGYNYKEADIKGLLTEFDSDGYDEMVILRGIEFTSFCEHHWLPFTGTAHIGYIPNKKVVGISKLARLLDVYAKRLQIQERLCVQPTNALMKYIAPQGAGCVIVAKHACISCRGIGKQHSEMITSSLEGSFKTEGRVRGEFLALLGV